MRSVSCRGPIVGGLVVGAIGYGILLMTVRDSAAGFSSIVPGMAVIASGTGVAAPAMTAAALSGVEQAEAGTSSAVLTTARQLGGVLGVALFGGFVAGNSAHMTAGVSLAFIVSAALFLGAGGIAARWSK